MHTFITRANAILAYTLSVAACLTYCCFLSTVFKHYQTDVTLRTTNVAVKSMADYSASREKNDLGVLNFDIHADLSSLFNWNVKQLFVYLTAEYKTSNNEINQVILWDKIILRGDKAVLDFKNMNTKYYFWDDGNGLRGHNNVTLYLSWNIIPNAGLLPSISSINKPSLLPVDARKNKHVFSFPSQYKTSRV